MRIFILDGNKMTERQSAYDHIQNTLLFPDYFGRNLDALEDCLSELGRDNIIIITNADAIRDSLGEYGNRMLEIFKENSRDSYIFAEQ